MGAAAGVVALVIAVVCLSRLGGTDDTQAEKGQLVDADQKKKDPGEQLTALKTPEAKAKNSQENDDPKDKTPAVQAKEPQEPDKSRDEKPAPRVGEPKEADDNEAPVALVDGRLPGAVLDRVKKATVHIRVTMPGGQVAQGSGFFGIEPGVVLTNAHVLGMLQPNSRQPQKIQLVLNSGTPQEKTLVAQVLGVDRATDLAVLRAPADKGLPTPLTVKSAQKLQETEPVFVFGFPLGDQLGKNISVRKSSVSALRLDNQGNLEKVQVEGGMDPGNSGGPVVNSRGHVVGVAVSKIMATQINFAVPGDFVKLILNGRVTSFGIDPPVKNGTEINAGIHVNALDPLNRIREVRIEVCMGKKAQRRPASRTEPKPEAGDSPVQSYKLDYKNGRGSGTLKLPPLAVGQTYWLRTVCVNGAGETFWYGGTPHNPGSPLERKPAVLSVKHEIAKRLLEIKSDGSLTLVASDGESHKIVVNMLCKFDEMTKQVTPQGTANIRLQYQRLSLTPWVDGKSPPVTKQSQDMVSSAVRIGSDLTVDRRNQLLRFQLDMSRVPRKMREDAKSLHEQVQQSLEAIAIPLPDKEVNPGETWMARRPVATFSGVGAEAGVMQLTYTYRGTRVRDGREEAVISFKGTVRGTKGRELRIGGKAEGTASLDLSTGQIAQAQVTVTVDLDAKFGRSSAKANGTLKVVLARKIANQAMDGKE